ncbi:MAG: hypothetical protein KA604_02070 [Candidatus Saccharimonas sp.]|nr:hypothetical protein [Candidatus Saccharimonas sp.]
MIQHAFLVILAVIGSVVWTASPVHALSLKIAPLEYTTNLVKGEKKKGFVDISNPSNIKIKASFHVMRFEQINDSGGLQFKDDAELNKGIRLDLKEIELEARETLHLAFLLDASELPTGDVFAAIMARTTFDQSGSATQAIQVGSLLFITNGTPGSHTAIVSKLTAPFFQIGTNITASTVIENTAPPNTRTGFRPQITYGLRPYYSGQTIGPLLFAGRSRQVDIRIPGNYFGPTWVTASAGSGEKGQLVFCITGYWRWLAPLIATSGVLALLLLRRTRISFRRMS